MAHKFSLSERIRGVRGAIASPRTPEHLNQPLIRELHKLENRKSKTKQRAKRAREQNGLLAWFRL